MAVLLPFNRMVVGPMDYTPGAMINLQRSNFHPMFTRPASMGTRCQQLAMYVLYVSPLQMLADTPTHYRENPESLPFLRRVPVTWDETRVLHAEVGELVVVARRKGKAWYIGALTNWEPRDLTLSLSFLVEGPHDLTAWSDGPNADKYGGDVRVEGQLVDRNNELKIHLAPGGGYAAIVEPKN
jgi:alpha-glucosidase